LASTSSGAPSGDAINLIASNINVSGPLNVTNSATVGGVDLQPSVARKIQVAVSSTGIADIVAGQDTTHNLQMFWVYNATPASASAGIVTAGYSNPLSIDASAVTINGSSGGTTTISKAVSTFATFTVATLPAGVLHKTVGCSNCRVFNGAGVQEGVGAGTGSLVTYNSSAWKLPGTNVTAVA
jgi:hypothetical protein